MRAADGVLHGAGAGAHLEHECALDRRIAEGEDVVTASYIDAHHVAEAARGRRHRVAAGAELDLHGASDADGVERHRIAAGTEIDLQPASDALEDDRPGAAVDRRRATRDAELVRADAGLIERHRIRIRVAFDLERAAGDGHRDVVGAGGTRRCGGEKRGGEQYRESADHG